MPPTPQSSITTTPTTRASMSPTTASPGNDGGGNACGDVAAIARPSAPAYSDVGIDRGARFFRRSRVARVDSQMDTPWQQPGCKNDYVGDPMILSSFHSPQNRANCCPLEPLHISPIAAAVPAGGPGTGSANINESSNTDLPSSLSTSRRGSFLYKLRRQRQIARNEENPTEYKLNRKSNGFWDYEHLKSETMAGEGDIAAEAMQEANASTQPIAHSGRSSLRRRKLMRGDSPTAGQAPMAPAGLKPVTKLSSVAAATHEGGSGEDSRFRRRSTMRSGISDDEYKKEVHRRSVLHDRTTGSTTGALDGAMDGALWLSGGDEGAMNTSTMTWHSGGLGKGCTAPAPDAAERQEGSTRNTSQHDTRRKHSFSGTEGNVTPQGLWGVKDGEERLADAATPQFNRRISYFRADGNSLLQMGSHVGESRQRRGSLEAALHHPSFTGGNGESKGPMASTISKTSSSRLTEQSTPKLGTPRLGAAVEDSRHRGTQPNRNASEASNATNREGGNGGWDSCLPTSTGDKVSPHQISKGVSPVRSSTSILLKLFPGVPDGAGGRQGRDLSVGAPHEFGLWKRTKNGPSSSPVNENRKKSELSSYVLSDTHDSGLSKGADFPVSSQILNVPKDRHSVGGGADDGGGGGEDVGNRSPDSRELLLSSRPSKTTSTGAANRTALLLSTGEHRGVGGNCSDNRSNRSGGVEGEANRSHHNSCGSSRSYVSSCNLLSTAAHVLSFSARNTNESHQSDACKDSIQDTCTNHRISVKQAQLPQQHAPRISPQMSPRVARATTRPLAYAPAHGESGMVKGTAETVGGLKAGPPSRSRSGFTSMGRLCSEAGEAGATAENQGDFGSSRSSWGSSGGNVDTVSWSRLLEAPTKTMRQGPPSALCAADIGYVALQELLDFCRKLWCGLFVC